MRTSRKGSESAVTARSTAASAVRSSPRRAAGTARRPRSPAATAHAAAAKRFAASAASAAGERQTSRATSSPRSLVRAFGPVCGRGKPRLATFTVSPRRATRLPRGRTTTRSPPSPAIRTAGAPMRLWKAGNMTVACSVPSPRTVQPRRCGFNFGLKPTSTPIESVVQCATSPATEPGGKLTVRGNPLCAAILSLTGAPSAAVHAESGIGVGSKPASCSSVTSTTTWTRGR